MKAFQAIRTLVLPLALFTFAPIPASEDPAPGEPPLDQEAALREAPEEARALWERFLEATYGDAEPEPVRAYSFDADFLRRGDAGSNDERLTLRFLEPRFVHLEMRSGREQGRGPGPGGDAFDWFREKGEVVELEGREYESDRAELDRLVALSRNFLALANARRLRIANLRPTRPPFGMPSEGKVESRSLEWIAFESPDFRLPGSVARPGEEATHEVLLGIEAETGLVKRAWVAEIARGTPGSPARPRALAAPLFFAFDRHERLSGVRVPKAVRVYEVGEGGAFADAASYEVYVLGGTLRPELEGGDFLP